jgi:geranylgeranyl diphosphate synthase type I
MKNALALVRPLTEPVFDFVWPGHIATTHTTQPIGLRVFRQQFQPHLDKFIAGKMQAYEAYSQAPNLRALWDYPRCLALAGGKRVRPFAAYLMYRGVGGKRDEQVLPLLVSLELFHLFCLVHDDLIDNGTERHGLPTVQCTVTESLLEQGCPQSATRIGKAQALLLGDMLFAWAQEAWHETHFPSQAAKGAAWRYFRSMIDEVVIGEMLDVDMLARQRTSFAEIRRKMLLKTASYTFIRPLQIGAALAGRGKQAEAWCHDFGLALGVAFQIQDDLLDLTGTPSTTHKTLFSDLREGQHTYFTQYVFERGTQAQRVALKALLRSDLTPSDRPRVLALFEQSGALEAGRAGIARHLQEAHALLEDSPIPKAQRGAFCNLLELIENRQA